MNDSVNDDYDCIGGEGWYTVGEREFVDPKARVSSDFLISVPRMLFSDAPDLSSFFRSTSSIRLGNIQEIRLSEYERQECRFVLSCVYLQFTTTAKPLPCVLEPVSLSSNTTTSTSSHAFKLSWLDGLSGRSCRFWSTSHLHMKKCLRESTRCFAFFRGPFGFRSRL